MDDLIEFKLKKGGPNKDKVILFIIMKKENIGFDPRIQKSNNF